MSRLRERIGHYCSGRFSRLKAHTLHSAADTGSEGAVSESLGMASAVAPPEKQAEILKDMGNIYFKKERFGAAIEAYTEVWFSLPFCFVLLFQLVCSVARVYDLLVRLLVLLSFLKLGLKAFRFHFCLWVQLNLISKLLKLQFLMTSNSFTWWDHGRWAKPLLLCLIFPTCVWVMSVKPLNFVACWADILDLQPILDRLTGVLNDMVSLYLDCGGIFVLRPECLLTNLDDLLSRQ